MPWGDGVGEVDDALGGLSRGGRQTPWGGQYGGGRRGIQMPWGMEQRGGRGGGNSTYMAT